MAAVLTGLAVQGNELKALKLFPGEVPTVQPNTEDWPEERFQFAEFMPATNYREEQPLPNIRMGRMLELLLGDVLE